MDKKGIAGVIVFFLIVLSVIGPLSPQKIYALITFAVFIFLLNKIMSWKEKAKRLDEQKEAQRLSEWHREIDQKGKNGGH